MGGAMNIQPLFGVGLVGTDFGAYTRAKDLRAASGHGTESGVNELAQYFLHAHRIDLREEENLDGGKGFDMDMGIGAFQCSHHLWIVAERQPGMVAGDDMEDRKS